MLTAGVRSTDASSDTRVTCVRMTLDTTTGSSDAGPVYSPDGSRIAFRRWVPGELQGDIWVMNADGSNPHPTFTAAPWDSAPDWGPAPR